MTAEGAAQQRRTAPYQAAYQNSCVIRSVTNRPKES